MDGCFFEVVRFVMSATAAQRRRSPNNRTRGAFKLGPPFVPAATRHSTAAAFRVSMRRAQAKGVAQLLAARICLDGRHFFGIQRQQVVPAFISNSSADHSLAISRYVRAE